LRLRIGRNRGCLFIRTYELLTRTGNLNDRVAREHAKVGCLARGTREEEGAGDDRSLFLDFVDKSDSPIAGARRSATRIKQAEALKKWNPSELPKWLDEDFYRREVLPRLVDFTVKRIQLAIDVSHPYATLIKRGERIPHPMHWLNLGRLVGVAGKLPMAEQPNTLID
jgi:hypothetical protein